MQPVGLGKGKISTSNRSVESIITVNSQFTLIFRVPGKCCSEIIRWLWRHHSQKLTAKFESRWEWAPPILMLHATKQKHCPWVDEHGHALGMEYLLRKGRFALLTCILNTIRNYLASPPTVSEPFPVSDWTFPVKLGLALLTTENCTFLCHDQKTVSKFFRLFRLLANTSLDVSYFWTQLLDLTFINIFLIAMFA